MLAVEKHVSERWCLFYIKRWLNAPVLKKSGELVQKQGKGTPQGGVISPLLANLILHYTMDKWLELKHETVNFERYADDAIIHCKSKAHAEWLLEKIRRRMADCGLELHPEKTKLVYCRDHKRQGNYPVVKFDFLGYSFQPRTTKSKRTGKLFLGYDCAISISSQKRIADKMEELNIVGLTFKSIVGVAQFLNPFIRGWVNYYGKFRKHEMNSVFQLLRNRLVRWARRRYKRYKTSITRAYKWLETVKEQFPSLFYHWQIGLSN
jgi:group II intron reverse transcriptase/maturase